MKKLNLDCLYHRCDICFTEDCGGKKDCHCKTCEHLNDCYKLLHATIRITNRCTQKCSHCCFSSSPESNIMMSVDMANDIARFLRNNQVIDINVLGGEFYCNPDWFQILDVFANNVLHMRLVTNCDWAASDTIKQKIQELISLHDNIHFSLSKDKWHTNKHVDEAAAFLDSIDVKYNIATEEETKDESIVPIGRGELTYMYANNYSMFGCYCHDPKNEYTFLIDEKGYIYKCAFGTWKYAEISEYIDGGFRKRFKEYNIKVNKCFISNCLKCRQAADRWNRTKDADYEQIVIDTE